MKFSFYYTVFQIWMTQNDNPSDCQIMNPEYVLHKISITHCWGSDLPVKYGFDFSDYFGSRPDFSRHKGYGFRSFSDPDPLRIQHILLYFNKFGFLILSNFSKIIFSGFPGPHYTHTPRLPRPQLSIVRMNGHCQK